VTANITQYPAKITTQICFSLMPEAIRQDSLFQIEVRESVVLLATFPASPIESYLSIDI